MTMSMFARDAEDHIRRAMLRWSCRHFARCRVPVAALGDAISTEILIRGYFEAHALSELACLLQNNPQIIRAPLAIDVGANIGNHAIFLSHHFQRVIAFEPNPITFHILNANALMTNAAIEPVNIALASTNGAAEIAFGGADLGGASLGARPSDARRFPVQTATLDGWLSASGVASDAIGFIKIDVEGHESDVIAGARSTLRSSDALVAFETAPDTEPSSLITPLREAGYRHFYEIQKRANASGRVKRCFEFLRYGAERRTVASTIEGLKYREMALASKQPLHI